MRIIITGTPGTGKTTMARAIAKKTQWPVLHETELCRKKRIGRKNRKGEREVPLNRLEKALNEWLAGKGNAIAEGHMLCETRAKADLAVVLECGEKELYRRLKKKGYSEEKILDNLFCEKTGYCMRNAKKNYKNTVGVETGKGIKAATAKILKETRKY